MNRTIKQDPPWPHAALAEPDRQVIRKPVLFWLLQTGGWSAFGGAMYLWALSYQDAGDAFVNKLLLVGLGFLLTLAARSLFRIARRSPRSPLAIASLLVVVSFVGAVLWRETHFVAFQLYLDWRSGSTLDVALAWIPIGTLLYDSFVLLAWSLLYFVINNTLELERQAQRLREAEGLAYEARLRALRAQIEPHFLFNTLNSISTLVAEGEGASARAMIARLSDFFRLTLERSDSGEISIAEELEFVRRYLEIEQARFGERLKVIIDAPAELQGARVPTLVLQPLVENAVKHGILGRESGGVLAIRITRNHGSLRLSVTDDGAGSSSVLPSGSGRGLAITRARLAAVYGDAARFDLSRSDGGGTAASIEIPYRTADQAELTS